MSLGTVIFHELQFYFNAFVLLKGVKNYIVELFYFLIYRGNSADERQTKVLTGKLTHCFSSLRDGFFLNSNKTPAYKKQSSCLCLLFIEYVWFMSVILQYDVGDAPAHWFSCQITCDNAASVPLTRQGTRLVSMAYIIVYDNSPRNFLALFAIKQYTKNSFRINQQPNDSNGKKILNRKMFFELSEVKEIYLQPFNTVGNRRQV